MAAFCERIVDDMMADAQYPWQELQSPVQHPGAPTLGFGFSSNMMNAKGWEKFVESKHEWETTAFPNMITDTAGTFPMSEAIKKYNVYGQSIVYLQGSLTLLPSFPG